MAVHLFGGFLIHSMKACGVAGKEAGGAVIC